MILVKETKVGVKLQYLSGGWGGREYVRGADAVKCKHIITDGRGGTRTVGVLLAPNGEKDV